MDKWVTPPPRRIPWVKIAIAAVIVVAVLTVIGLMVPPEETGSVAVNPAGVWETDLVSVSGSGFTPGEKVDVFLDGSIVDTVTADSAGAFSGMVAVHGKRQGTIKAVGRQSQNQASSLFTAPAGPASQGSGSSAEASIGPASESPAGPVSPGILYWSDTEPGSTVAGHRQLYFIDPATPGGVPEQLTTDDVDSSFPAWSPDYSMMAFARGAPQGRDIWYRDSQGDHQLTTAASDDWYPTWAKDGWIAYSSRTSTESSIRALRIDGGGEDHLIFSGEGVRTPNWSPNGDKLAFKGDLYGANNDDVMTVLADGTGLDRLTNDAAADRNPTWSPNGDAIAFVRNEGNSGNDKDNEIYLMDVATKAVKRLTTNDVQDGNPVWSSDGSQIAAFRTSRDGFHIWVINIDETGENLGEQDLMPNAHGLNQDPNWR